MAARGSSQATIGLRRAYDPPVPADGTRILVDRLWPRGLAKARARIDLWLKEVAPSDALRHRFHADPSAWPAFRAEYLRELGSGPQAEAFTRLRGLVGEGPVALLFASHDTEHNNAVVLREALLGERCEVS